MLYISLLCESLLTFHIFHSSQLTYLIYLEIILVKTCLFFVIDLNMPIVITIQRSQVFHIYRSTL
jgi:hypothetical protein